MKNDENVAIYLIKCILIYILLQNILLRLSRWWSKRRAVLLLVDAKHGMQLFPRNEHRLLSWRQWRTKGVYLVFTLRICIGLGTGGYRNLEMIGKIIIHIYQRFFNILYFAIGMKLTEN